jgi:outer membrane protein
MQVYREAQQNDPAIAAARANWEATQERVPQARAGLLPNVALSASANANYFGTNLDSDPHVGINRNFGIGGLTVSASQPLYRYANSVAYSQAVEQVQQADYTLASARQDLILRVAIAYFDVLLAQFSVEVTESQKAAVSEQLAQAKRNFEVGTATITDTHEAQARYDLIVAQEIVAQNDLESKRRSLQAITGKEYTQLKPLRSDVRMSPPEPNDMQSWVEIAEKQAYPVVAQEAATQVAQLEVKRASGAHWPTIDLVGSYGNAWDTGSQVTAIGRDITTGQIGVQLAFPLYQGGGLSSREREAAANYLKSRQDLENARRTAALGTRQSYLAVINGIAQIAALEQALTSSQSALDSNRLGYEVGVRINIDVLNAQQQVFSTRRDLAVARYNAIINHLRLKAAAGTLRDEDLELVNRALQP